MAARLHFIVEGQTEEAFVNEVLRPHLESLSVWAAARCVETTRKRGQVHRGGLSSYTKAKSDITAWMSEDRNADARFTTMFDLYALPGDFPGNEDLPLTGHPYERVRALEDALRKDISDPRFIPYIQLHEFEALLLADPQKLEKQFYDRGAGIQRLAAMASGYKSPELINEGNETAPSKRIIGEIPEYDGLKASAGPIVASYIGLPTLRSKCAHFGEWLDELEQLGDAPAGGSR